MAADGFARLPSDLMQISNINQSVAINSHTPVNAFKSPMEIKVKEMIEFDREDSRFNSTLLPSLNKEQIGGRVVNPRISSNRNLILNKSEMKDKSNPNQNSTIEKFEKSRFKFPERKKYRNATTRIQGSDDMTLSKTVD